ncbi:hypothetical protein M9H77_30233 [Catharanthus roseus]|uniref:Uncharacterized protein n=1 Tax=Catharanthus roseus TaxID=4058 RepID=A0ACB9ZXK5_CATRO|nr:hypothetical protein M9H77_30233 [Catharanthus roseus]
MAKDGAIGRQEMAYSKIARARSNCSKDGGYGGNVYGGSHHRDGYFTYRSQMGIGNFSYHAKAFGHILHEHCCENSRYDVHKGYHGSHDYSDQNCSREINHEGLIGFLEFDLAYSTSYSRCISYSCYEVVKFLFCDVMGQRDHSLFVNVPHQVINLDRTHLLVVQDSFHDRLVFIAHDVELWNICDSLGDANHRTIGFLGNNSYGFYGSLFSLIGDNCVKFQGEVVEHLQYMLTSLDLM